ncbi:hypothetical protein [uncultured Psychromonas sp.]|uniref:hypothetical protein n=1 Tax=uncultured Psychromonas sp. TaxID=173974 RepID=UPI00261B00E9|nr:hypothetical protein [uncultured Psychromonas sp.]
MSCNDQYSELKSEKSRRQSRYVKNVLNSKNISSRGSSFGKIRKSNNALSRLSFAA